MEIGKLFQVLVVGGVLLAIESGCASDDMDVDESTENLPARQLPDASQVSPDGALVGSDASNDELAPCFCDSEACCERADDGTGELRDGFTCCWATC